MVRPVLLLSLLLLSSCGLFKPGAERQCRKAEGLINKAVRICPEAAQLEHDTLRLTLPGDSTGGTRALRQEDIDSVLADCQQIREALDAERVLMEFTNGVASRIVRRHQLGMDSLRNALLMAAQKRTRATTSLRRQLCPFEAIHDSTALHDLRISWSPSGVLYTIRDFPRTVEMPITHQTITAGPVSVQESINGWLMAGTAFGWLVAVVLFLMFKSERHMRLNTPPKR